MKFYILLLSFIATLNIGNAQVYYVDIDATGNNDGGNWADAYTDLQDAIDAATVNQEIWVAAGTYLPTKDHTGNASPTDLRDKNFHLNTDMKIYGGFAGTETLLSERNFSNNVSILSGDTNNDDVVTGGGSTLSFSNNTENVYHVIITANLTSAAVIDGFTIIGGNANGANSVVYESISYDRGFGGGMYNKNSSSPTIINSTIANNSTDSWGGGIYNTGSSSPKVINSILSKNNAGSGGGMGNSSSAPVITNTIFANNNSGNGGAMFNFSSSPMLTNSIIWDNGSTELSANSSSVPSFMNSIIKGSGGSENWDTDYGADNGANLDADPFFVDLENGVYSLLGCSDAINAGATVAHTMDILGNPHIGIVDIGAYEYQSTAYTSIIYVNKIATGNNDGSSWADAYTDLQDAIDNQCGGIDIWVAEGTYLPTKDHTGSESPTSNRDKNFHLGTDMNIYGGFVGTETMLSERDWVNNVTILSGDFNDNDNVTGGGSSLTFSGNTENAYHVMITANLSAAAAIDGFTIKGGNASSDNGSITYKTTTFHNGFGGGLYNKSSSPTISNLTFINNYVNYRGGGMYNTTTSSPLIMNSIFTNNKAGDGGGMANSYSSPTVTNTSFTNNNARGFYTSGFGGGMSNTSSSPTITNSTFDNNYALRGGGMMNYTSSSPEITNSSFTTNKADSWGGGMYNEASSSPIITNSTFASNSASDVGAGMYNRTSSSPTIVNTIIWGNGSDDLSNFLISSPSIQNSIIKGCGGSGSWNSEYGSDDGGNLDSAPLYVNAENGEYTLNGCSSAINAGTAVTHTTDILGNPHVGAVDMGAYEYQEMPYGNNNAIHVNLNATGNNNGSSWTDAFTDLQKAIDYQCSGLDIWVAVGTYYPTYSPDEVSTDLRDRNFHLGSDMKIYGGFAGNETLLSERDWATNITILSGDFNDDDVVTGGGSTLAFSGNTENAYHVLITANLTAASVIDGFTFKGGNANGSGNASYQSIAFSRGYGGAMYNKNASSPMITNSIITNNKANVRGGGIYNTGASSPTVINSIFSNNNANNGGGGMANSASSPIITNSTFANNNALDDGGGIFSEYSSPMITNSIIWGNGNTEVYNTSSMPTFKNSIIKGSGGSESWNADYGTDNEGNLDSSPLYVNAENGEYILNGCSPAINAGTAVTHTTDILGNPHVGAVDIGAYEYQEIPYGNNNAIHVNLNATGNNNGTSWTDAYTDLQKAIDNKCSGLDIWVAMGTYYPTASPDGISTDLRDRNFHLGTDMKIYGGFAGNEALLSERDWATNITILSGDFNDDDVVTGGGSTLALSGNDENAYHVMITANLTAASVIDGFTIKGGNANGTNSTIYGTVSFDRGYGGAMYNKNASSPMITNSIITNNSANFLGGGIYNTGASSPIIINSIFSNNNANEDGGGMANKSSSSPIITNSTFTNNNALDDGGGIYNLSSSPMITNSIIWDNGNTEVYNISATPTFQNSIIKGSGGSESWNADYGTDNGGNLDTDPFFVDAANLDYSIGGCSPAINAGTTVTDTTDILGNPHVGIVDIGAYEYQGVLFTSEIYVNVNATGNNDGSSWQDAYTNLQDAMDNQCGGLDIWVAAGTYLPTKDHTGNETPTDNRDKNFHLSTDMKIYGGFAGTETLLSGRDLNNNETILSGDFNNDDVVTGGGSTLAFSGNSENAYHVMIIIHLTSATFIDGFSIKGGNANGSGSIYFEPDVPSQEFRKNFGGGLYSISGSQPTIINSHFTNNSANSGGGMYINDGEHRIINSSITNNKASNGGGIFNFFCDTDITNSTVTNNDASSGGGLYYEESSLPTITNSIIWNNGNSEVLNGNSTPSITNSIIKGSGGSATWNSDYGLDNGGNLDSGPFFVDEANGEYSISGCSPAINTGATVTHTTDILGNPHVGIVDIGAYEYQDTPIMISITTSTVTQPNCDVPTGTIVVNASTSAGTLQYSIDDGMTYQPTATFSGLSAANYIVKVQEVGSSCSATYSSNPVVISPLMTVTDPTITQTTCDVISGTIVVNTTTTESILEYSIDDGMTYQSSATFSGLAGGSYTIIVREQGLLCAHSYPNNPVVINTPPYTSEIYVNVNATGNNNGSSWTDAYIDLQDAIDNQCGAFDIWVAAGTYLPTKDQTGNETPTDNRDKNFHLSTNMKIYGGFAGTETLLSQRDFINNKTILSGDFNNDDVVTGGGGSLTFSGNDENAYHVMITTNITYATVIDGFTMKGGNANGSGYTFYQSVVFYRNLGGAMYNENYVEPPINNNNNNDNNKSSVMSNENASLTIANSIFTNNYAGNDGGGMFNQNAAPIITNSTFSNNIAVVRGGGMYNSYNAPTTITNSIFTHNKANNDGGGMANYYASPIITNSTFTNNDALGDGGGIYNFSASSSPMISNSIIWDNGSTEVIAGTSTFKNSMVKGSGGSSNWNSDYGTDNGGNLDTDPQFVDIVNGDFSLQICSNGINGGDSTSWANTGLSTDIEGNTRPYNNTIVDIGAYEFQDTAIVITVTTPTVTQPTCAVPTGTIVVNASTFAGTLEYSIDDGMTYQPTATFTGLSVANYIIKVQEVGSSCAASYGSNPVVISSLIIIDPTITQPNCLASGTIVVNTTTTESILEYSIDDGVTYQDSATFSGLAEGNYTIIVREQGLVCTESYPNNPVVINTPYSSAIYVNANATGNNDGSSWADAYIDLQDAMDNQCGGLDIWVAAGTYFPTKDHTGNKTPTDNRDKNFHLSTDMKIYGGFAGTETLLSERNWKTNETVLNGDFNSNDTITGGGSTLAFSGNDENAYHVMITANLTNATVIDGFAFKGGNANGTNSVVYGSASFNRGYGGAMYNKNASAPMIKNSIITNNNAIVRGGGIYNTGASSPTVINSIFSNNNANDDGGGMANSSSSPIITNSTFTNNNALDDGGGIYNQSSSPIITNSIFWDNGNTEVYNTSTLPTWKNSIIKGSGGSANWYTSYGTDNGGNLDTDPLFVDEVNEDYTLSYSSPARNAGDGIFGISLNTDTLDLAAYPRFVDEIDMGAYENQCKEHLVLGVADSPLSGIYQAKQTITISGAVEVLPGVAIELTAPKVTVDDSMIINLDAVIHVTPDGCN